MGRKKKNKISGPVPSAVLHFRPVHFDLGNGEIACHPSNEDTAKKSTHPEMVDCLRCKNSYHYRSEIERK